jgi:hypothetical protein
LNYIHTLLFNSKPINLKFCPDLIYLHNDAKLNEITLLNWVNIAGTILPLSGAVAPDVIAIFLPKHE